MPMRADRQGRFGHTVAATPDWFRVAEARRTFLRGVATLASNSASGDQRVLLEVSLETTGVRVRETVPGTQFPKRCPERHVEDGGWFCLGLSSGWMVEDAETAVAWWAALEHFLRLQRVATRSGVWPDQNALSHGGAGFHHRAALSLAAQIGMSETYDRHVAGEQTVIKDLDAKLVRDSSRLINGRCCCPCGRRHASRPVIRRKCPHRTSVVRLLREERERVAKLAGYWREMDGTPCCGTMRSCPLMPIGSRLND